MLASRRRGRPNATFRCLTRSRNVAPTASARVGGRRGLLRAGSFRPRRRSGRLPGDDLQGERGRTGRSTFIVVHSLSRFSRDSLHSELYVRKLRKAGVELVSITQTSRPTRSGEMSSASSRMSLTSTSRARTPSMSIGRCARTPARAFGTALTRPLATRPEIAERRGNKDKKVLVVDDEEARVVREIFALAAGREGRPVGVKAIACRLNDRGVTRRGVRFSTGSVYELLTSRHLLRSALLQPAGQPDTARPVRPRSGWRSRFPRSSTNRPSTRFRRSCRAAARNGCRRASPTDRPSSPGLPGAATAAPP